MACHRHIAAVMQFLLPKDPKLAEVEWCGMGVEGQQAAGQGCKPQGGLQAQGGAASSRGGQQQGRPDH